MLWLLMAFLPAGSSAATPEITLFLNGNIYTGNERSPHAEAVAVESGRIVFVGSNDEGRAFQKNRGPVVDLMKRTVVPGLTDSHCHIFGIGEREMTLNLEGSDTREDFLNRIKERAARMEPGKWITGRGWIETFWQPPEFPTRDDLDRVVPDNPVWLTRADGHAAIANSAALKLAGIDGKTANPFGGEILKDKKTGEPTGMLLDNAQPLVAQKIPKPTEAEREQAFLRGVKREIELGWCEIQNAGSNPADVSLIRRAFESGKVKLRIYNAVYGPGPAADALLRDGIIVNEGGRRFTQRTIKVVFDGALGSRGAALLAPYSDAPDSSGFLREKESDLVPLFENALRRGIQVETHAIGDRANRTILDLYEQAFRNVKANERQSGRKNSTDPLPSHLRDVRWRVEHAQILSPQDIPRFAKLGVIASMQPSHAIGDLFFAPSRLGTKRLEGAYAWKSLIKSGAIVIAGSDAPVERGEPLIEFYAAVTRKSPKGFSADGWHPEQAVSREQALKMLTQWPAYAAFEEKEKGSIEIGKSADFTVFSKDILKIPAPEILTTKCEMTVIDGEIVFERENRDSAKAQRN